jgi:predicted RNA-binding protein
MLKNFRGENNMERIDNLIVKVIDNKVEFLSDLINNKKELGNVLSIDLVDLSVSELIEYSLDLVLEQANKNNNRYLWVEKFHAEPIKG